MMDDPIVLTDIRVPRSDAVKNRERLLRTAAQLFVEQGVDEVTMSAVAQAAGVGKGTLYRHFTNKSDLCLALLDQDQRELQSKTLTRLRLQGDAVADLSWFLGEVAAFVDRNSAMLYSVDMNMPMALYHAAHTWWRQTIYALLLRAGAQGDVDYSTDTLYVMVSPQVLYYQMYVHQYPLERIIAGLHNTLSQILGIA